MDVWNAASFLFITVALLEFVLVQFLSSGESEKEAESGKEAEFEKEAESNGLIKKLAPVKNRADKICRIAFPIAYLIFLVLYCAIYVDLQI